MIVKNNKAADNPLLARCGLPEFDYIEAKHVVPGVRKTLEEAQQQLEQLEKNVSATWAGTIEALDDIDRRFEYGWSPVSHLFGVKNSPELREAYEEVLGEMVTFGLLVKQSEPIYKAIKAIRNGDEWQSLDGAQQRIIERKILQAELAGIGLEDKPRERFNEITRELSQLSTDFSNHVLDSTKAFSLVLTDKEDVQGLPESLLQLSAQSYNQLKDDEDPEATPEDGPWQITLDMPSFGPFLQHCRNRELREQVYRVYVTRASQGDFDNSGIISRILKLRKEKAQLLGFDTFADMSLAEKMARDVKAVTDMFETLQLASWDAAQTDRQEIQQLAAESGFDEPLMHWDTAFWSERLRESRFAFTDEDLRPYFSLERVMKGMFRLVHRLFGVLVTPADGDAPIWHDDVRFFKVADEKGYHIASFYLDPYSRPENKRGGAWMDECLTRRRTNGKLQVPVAHLVCNATPPVGDKPSLMTFREVETLFHEFGHGLQQMLTRVEYADASGINGVEWDAVELASQFMENWCYHKPTLVGMTAHYETGEPLPDILFEKICEARNFRAGSLMLRQLLFGMTDMYLHHEFDPEGDRSVFDVHREISEKTSVLPLLPEDRSLCAFQHIFAGGYSAGYYSYKWAEVLSADAFGAFEEAGLDNDQAITQLGRRFRNTVLALGGSKHPLDVFKEFRGREPSPEPLLRQYGLT